MGEVKRTPGPWNAETFVDNRPNGSEHHTYRITPQRGVYGSMFEADAKLAAAAPELLDALKELFATVEGECPRLLDEDRGANPHLYSSIVDAIAKAEGRAESPLSTEGEEGR